MTNICVKLCLYSFFYIILGRGPAVQRSCEACSLKFTNSSTHMAHIAMYHSQISDQDIQQNIETTIEHSDLIVSE